MAVFTISKGGKTLESISLDGERIELGSANACRLFIDDLLVSLKQAAFLRSGEGFEIEPLARTPQMTLNGQVITQRTPIPSGGVIEVEGYQIRIETGAARPAAAASVPPPPVPPVRPAPPPPPPPPPPLEEGPPPLDEALGATPPPLQSEPDLPPPLELDSLPPLPPLESVPPPPSPSAAPSADDNQRTVFVSQPLGALVAVSGPLRGQSWPLVPGEVRIGREEAKNDVVINKDASGALDKSISRRHASVFIDGKTAYVEDQGSVAGTFVNGRQLAPKDRVPLKAGDQIEIRSAKESTVLRVDIFGQAAPSPAPPPRATPPPPPPPQQPPSAWTPPKYEQPPPRHEEPPSEREGGRRRGRPRPVSEDNPFAPGEAPGGMSSVPMWVWVGAGVGVLLLIVILLLFVF